MKLDQEVVFLQSAETERDGVKQYEARVAAVTDELDIGDICGLRRLCGFRFLRLSRRLLFVAHWFTSTASGFRNGARRTVAAA